MRCNFFGFFCNFFILISYNIYWIKVEKLTPCNSWCWVSICLTMYRYVLTRLYTGIFRLNDPFRRYIDGDRNGETFSSCHIRCNTCIISRMLRRNMFHDQRGRIFIDATDNLIAVKLNWNRNGLYTCTTYQVFYFIFHWYDWHANKKGNKKNDKYSTCKTYPVPIRGFPFRSQRKFTGKSPSSIWHEMAALIPSFNMFVIDWMGIIFGGTENMVQWIV